MYERIQNWLDWCQNAVKCDYPDPNGLKSLAVLGVAAAAVSLVALAQSTHDSDARANVVATSECTNLQDILPYEDLNGSIAVRNIGSKCIAVYNYADGAGTKDIGSLGVDETAHVVCLELDKPFAAQMRLAGTNGTSYEAASNASGLAYSKLLSFHDQIPAC